MRTRAAQCPRHQAEADARKGTRQSRGYDASWQRTRRLFLRLHPKCEWCPGRAKEVDHRNGDPTDNRFANLRGLCSLHHKQRTARDQPGGARLQ